MKALIGIWAEGDIQKEFDVLVKAKRCRRIWQVIYMNTAMTEIGSDVYPKLKRNTEQQRKTTTKKHSSSYYDDLDRVLGHRPAMRPPFASVGGLSVEPNQKGE